MEKALPQDTPLRILHTESSMELGGQEFRVLNEACGMLKRGHYVVLAVQPQSQIAKCARARGLCIEEVNMGRGNWVWLIIVFLKLMVKHDIHIVNTHGSIDSWTAAIAGRFSKRHPLIIRTRHKSTVITKTWRHRLLYQRLPHAVVTTGEAVRQIVITQTGVPEPRVISIPTGVDLETFQPQGYDNQHLKSERFDDEHAVVIGTVAFFRMYKGITYLLDAAKLVMGRFPNVKFLIVGDGPDYASILQKRDELGLGEHVVLTGFRDDVPDMLASMDIFVLASTGAEGVPQSLSQAMAMEKPVIATHVGSISELVKHEETGLLVTSKSADSLAEAMCRLVKNPELRTYLGQAARRHVEQSYSFSRMLSQTESVYREFLRSLNQNLSSFKHS